MLLQECEAFFPTPEFIPLKCQLYSDLLVRTAEICLDCKPDQTTKRKVKPSPQVHQAWKHLEKTFKVWKQEGKPKNPCSASFLQYKRARAKFQQTRRSQHNLRTIRKNNELMHSNISDRNKHLQLVKKMRGSQAKKSLTALYTPAGKCFGNNILEGFARDAELLGSFIGESPKYDNEFYRLCIQDNPFIFDFKGENCYRIPNMKIEDLDFFLNTDMKIGQIYISSSVQHF